jgi:WD40 repeat protein
MATANVLSGKPMPYQYTQILVLLLMILLPPSIVSLAFATDAGEREEWQDNEEPRTDCYGDRLPDGAVARLGTTRMRAWANAICFFPDGKTLATAGDGVRLWDLNTGKTLKELVSGQRGQQTALAVSTDGKTLAWGGLNQPIVLWDLSMNRKLRELGVDAGASLKALAFSADGKSVAALVEKSPETFPPPPRVWEVATGRERDVQQPDQNGRTWWPLAGYHLAHLTDEEAAQMKLITASKGFHHATSGTDHPYIVVFCPAGKRLAAQYVDRTLRIWDLPPGKRSRELVVQKNVSASGHLVFSPDGTKLASSFDDCPIHVRDAATGEKIREFAPNCGWVHAMAFSPDSKSLAWAGDSHVLHLSSLETGKDLHQFEGHEGLVANLAFSPDNKTLISVAGDTPIRVWDRRSGKQIKTINIPRGNLIPALSRDGKTLAQIDPSHAISIWGVGTGTKVCQIKTEKHHPYQLVLSPDGKTLMSVGDDTYFWEVATGKELSHWRRGFGVSGWAISPHGAILAQGIGSIPGDGVNASKIELVDAKTGKRRAKFVSPGGVFPLIFSPDGKTLASGDDPLWVEGSVGRVPDQTLRLFDVSSGKEQVAFKVPHQGISAIAFSADGKTLACGDRQGTICLFDLSTRKQLAQLLGHDATIYSLVFSGDGLTLASGSADSTALVWDLTKWAR